jgi:hypothetical protein
VSGGTNGVIARILSDGTGVDTTFTANGYASQASVEYSGVKADGFGHYIVGAQNAGNNNNIYFVRYNSVGVLDTNFGSSGTATLTPGATGMIHNPSPLSETYGGMYYNSASGKTTIAFNCDANGAYLCLARVLADGTTDTPDHNNGYSITTSTTAGVNTLTLTTGAGGQVNKVRVGDAVSGYDTSANHSLYPPGTTIVSVNDGTGVVTFSANAYKTVSGTAAVGFHASGSYVAGVTSGWCGTTSTTLSLQTAIDTDRNSNNYVVRPGMFVSGPVGTYIIPPGTTVSSVTNSTTVVLTLPSHQSLTAKCSTGGGANDNGTTVTFFGAPPLNNACSAAGSACSVATGKIGYIEPSSVSNFSTAIFSYLTMAVSELSDGRIVVSGKGYCDADTGTSPACPDNHNGGGTGDSGSGWSTFNPGYFVVRLTHDGGLDGSFNPLSIAPPKLTTSTDQGTPLSSKYPAGLFYGYFGGNLSASGTANWGNANGDYGVSHIVLSNGEYMILGLYCSSGTCNGNTGTTLDQLGFARLWP